MNDPKYLESWHTFAFNGFMDNKGFHLVYSVADKILEGKKVVS